MPIIRPETPDDLAAIYTVNEQAFGRRGEADLVDVIRKSEHFIPQLSLVAEVDGRVVGHILFSRIHIETDQGRVPALALGPMAVLPGYQRQGIGSKLVREGLQACRQLGHALVVVLGHPNFYPRFGFSAHLARSLTCPFGDCGNAWMAHELVPGSLQGIRGRVVYPPVFDSVS